MAFPQSISSNSDDQQKEDAKLNVTQSIASYACKNIDLNYLLNLASLCYLSMLSFLISIIYLL
jgi:hypothetical protein